MKFKVGDKVKILPSATEVNVAESEIGEIGEITYVGFDVTVKTVSERYGSWFMRKRDITPVIKKGQQLLLWNDL